MNSYSYMGYVEVQADGTIKVLKENWLTEHGVEMKDHVAAGRMAAGIFKHCKVPADGPDLPPPGFYLTTARGLLEYGCDNDGGTVNVTFDRSYYGKQDERQMSDWFINPQARRPVWLRATIDGDD